MAIASFVAVLTSTQDPVLPELAVMRLSLPLLWASVLGGGTLLLTAKLTRRYRLGWTALVLLWTLLAGSFSPAYWLGLAFQSPSLSSALICLLYLWRVGWAPSPATTRMCEQPLATPDNTPWLVLGLSGIALGWALLLDTFAWWHVSIYAWGFSSASVACVALLTTLFWLIWGGRRAPQSGSLSAPVIVLLGALTLFVLTRLPSGNLWDALLDPWLWLLLQAHAIRAVWHLRAARRGPATTRAGTARSADTTGWRA